MSDAEYAKAELEKFKLELQKKKSEAEGWRGDWGKRSVELQVRREALEKAIYSDEASTKPALKQRFQDLYNNLRVEIDALDEERTAKEPQILLDVEETTVLLEIVEKTIREF